MCASDLGTFSPFWVLVQLQPGRSGKNAQIAGALGNTSFRPCSHNRRLKESERWFSVHFLCLELDFICSFIWLSRIVHKSIDFHHLTMTSVFAKLVPSLAVMMSTLQMASPLRAVLICRKHNTLGSLNPIPWAVSTFYIAGDWHCMFSP